MNYLILINDSNLVSICDSNVFFHHHMGLDARKPVLGVCCAPAQSDHHLCYSLIGKNYMSTCYRWNFNILASLCSWGDWFETRFIGNLKTGFLRRGPYSLTHCLLVSSADNLEIVWTQIRSDNISGQLSGHKLLNSKTGSCARNFWKLILKKNQQTTKNVIIS